jgi:uncharacterized membrane protein
MKEEHHQHSLSRAIPSRGRLRGSRPRPSGRVNLGLLAAAWNQWRADRTRLSAGTAAVLAVTAVDAWCGQLLRAGDATESPLVVHGSVAIQRPAQELYESLRNPTNLPQLLAHVASIEPLEHGRFRMHSKQVLGRSLSWDAEITDDVPSEQFSWRSLPGAAIASRGQVILKPLGASHGTSVSLTLELEPAAPSFAAPLARMLGDAPSQVLKTDLRRFKQRLETGETATTRGQPSGRRSLMSQQLP